ncbi:MAG: ATP-dependent zinc metalloprotease FtsH [Gammaproteobacteria bacterium]
MINQTQSPNTPKQPAPPSSSVIYLWWVLLALLLFWNLAAPLHRPLTSQVVKIPYSVFIEQLKADNIAKVQIHGSEISGTFVRAVTWPPASPQEPDQHQGFTDSSTETKLSAADGTHSQAPDASAAKQGTRVAHKAASNGQGESGVAQAYSAFATVFPETVGDPQLLPLLEAHGVQVVAEPPQTHWFMLLLMNALPLVLLVGFMWWMGQRATKQQGSIFGLGRRPARRFDSSQPRVTFADVAGADAAKQQLREEVDFLSNPDKYHAIGARIPRGVLLSGPPGTGKTLLARAVAGEASVPFFSISGSEFVEMFVGLGASRVRDLFNQAKASAPAIVFIDELDAVGRRRGAGLGTVNDEREQTLNQLLVEMDGFDERQNVIVLAATNRPDVLDPALQRPGRFDRLVTVDLPDRTGREGILRIHSQPLHLAPDVDLSALAGTTIGMSGAQLANLCNEAALVAARNGHRAVTAMDFEEALDKVVLGDVRPLVLDDRARQVTAYHEGGHALVAWLTPSADPVHKVTIVPHGQALGVTEQRPGADRYNFPKSYLVARVAVMLGGRTAEEIVVGDVTTGAENDLVEATRLARHMVMSWGMSDLGLAAYRSSGENRFLGYELGQTREYSETTATQIDQAVQRFLEEQHQVVKTLLMNAREQLDRLAMALLEQEMVDHRELIRLLGPRPSVPLAAPATPPRELATESTEQPAMVNKQRR